MHRTTLPDGLAVLHIGWLHVIVEEEKTRQSKNEGADQTAWINDANYI